MKSILPVFFFFSFFSFSDSFAQAPEKKSTSFDSQVPPFANAVKPNISSSNLTFKLIPAEKNTYCYDIYSDGRLLIHQPSVPGLPGNEGFATAADAEKVARLVIQKLKGGEMPPTVTTEEMKAMKVIR